VKNSEQRKIFFQEPLNSIFAVLTAGKIPIIKKYFFLTKYWNNKPKSAVGKGSDCLTLYAQK